MAFFFGLIGIVFDFLEVAFLRCLDLGGNIVAQVWLIPLGSRISHFTAA